MEKLKIFCYLIRQYKSINTDETFLSILGHHMTLYYTLCQLCMRVDNLVLAPALTCRRFHNNHKPTFSRLKILSLSTMMQFLTLFLPRRVVFSPATQKLWKLSFLLSFYVQKQFLNSFQYILLTLFCFLCICAPFRVYWST